MIIVDAHCDTITAIMEKGEEFYKNTGHIDLVRLKKYDGFVQFFAAFISPAHAKMGALRRAADIIDKLYREIEANKDDILLCGNYNEVISAAERGKVAAVLTIEGGDALEGSLSALRMLYKLGVRALTLTWNYRNQIADGVADACTGGGLTPFGKEVIAEMNGLGMLVDVSHLSEAGFWDVLNISTAPIIASHSNAKKICNHRRNLTDEQLLALKKNGGVTGINLCPDFVLSDGKASIEHVIKHIEHIISLTGEDTLGLGADYDGIDTTPEGLEGVQCINSLLNELLKLNYSETLVSKIAGQNFLRVIKNVLK
ncbi:membrane dipeptidase [Ruminiclostridium sufflavum DSM 19573]|uniref:Membrane dipeptidase n=1 Tax=Ruminiclostridium sufflavum DSM 19573 TaxID=1121337 RepID=A0A318Y520_9FIRM|nr:dipeptidase [Ruminiclostridium sufflavum]PYG87091.1 membrane dipeptidase [Ruminiclostridium sufflavum DSM 19573]